MNFRLALARIYVPFWIRRKKLRELFDLTAYAFGSGCPSLERLSIGEIMKRYAAYTREQAEALLSHGEDTGSVSEKLFAGAFKLGTALRKTLRISSAAEFMTAARLLYHMLGIELEGGENGQITIQKCFFSQYYPKAVCRLVSSLDSGILSGLAGGRGSLDFSERLTAGDSCCRAVFRMEKKDR